MASASVPLRFGGKERPDEHLVKVDVRLHESGACEPTFGVDLVRGLALHRPRDRGDALTSDRDVV